MRNLINLFETPSTLYHYSPRENRESIMQHGLMRSSSETAQIAKEMGEPNWHEAGGIFFSDTYEKPENPEAIDLWEVDVRGLNLERDETTDHDHLGEKWYVDWESESIAPERLNLLSDRIMENLVTEAPIEDIHHIGNWDKNSSYREQDRRLLTAPKAVAKIKAMWKYPEDVPYNIILVNNAEANRHTEVGLVKPESLATMFPKSITQIEPLIRSDAVNIIYTNNKGSERVPMTGWIMAHRFGHALFRFNSSYYFREAVGVLERYLDQYMDSYGVRKEAPRYSEYKSIDTPSSVKILQAICTFRSARENNLRNPMEAIHELFAQYIITGTLKFNPLPRSIKWKTSTYVYKYEETDYQSEVHSLGDLADELQSYFEAAAEYSVGKILVM